VSATERIPLVAAGIARTTLVNKLRRRRIPRPRG